MSPKKINFGKVPTGATVQQNVTVTNRGNVDLAAPVVSVTGTGFSLGENGCTSTILPSGTCTVWVNFIPPGKGTFKHGLLKFVDAGAKSPQKVKLMGVGLAPSPTATPTSTATTATTTATATPTKTATATATPTASPTATKSGTPTVSATPAATPTGTATPTTTGTKTATPTATATPPLNVVFLTSQTYDGSINGADGLTGADAACASVASAAHLPIGTYKAWLSTSLVSAISRLGSARGFIRPDGAPFADQISDISAGKILNPLVLDESGNFQLTPNDVAWTGSTNAGVVNGFACVDWTSASSSATGEVGEFDAGPGFWSDEAGAFPCSNTTQAHLYCFDTSHTTPLAITPVLGRVAFLSRGDFNTSTGVSGADALCQGEATSAGLANPTTFLALISTSTASAASRFDMSAMSKPFVRPDGIKIADAPTLASGAALDSGIWQYADGGYFSNPGGNLSGWTGSTAPNVTGTLADTCNSWTSNSSMVNGIDGLAITIEPSWWQASTNACSLGQSVYCLEQ